MLFSGHSDRTLAALGQTKKHVPRVREAAQSRTLREEGEVVPDHVEVRHLRVVDRAQERVLVGRFRWLQREIDGVLAQLRLNVQDLAQRRKQMINSVSRSNDVDATKCDML